jgi:hypothetical protein
MKLFLSYPSERLSQAREIYNFMIGHGLDVWFDKENLIAGQNWEREINKAQCDADMIVQVCSTEIVNKTGIIQKNSKTRSNC